jgi:hypothetical protein
VAARDRQRTVHFYELVEAKEGGRRLSQRDWPRILGRLRDTEIHERWVESAGERLIGGVERLESAPHLLIAKLRTDRPRKIDLDSGSISDLRLAHNQGLVDLTVLYFLRFGNVIATMGGGISAPRVRAIERWFNGARCLDEEILVRPVVNGRSREKLQEAGAIDKLVLRVEPEPTDSPTALRSSTGISSLMSRAVEEFPDLAITLTLESAKKRGRFSLPTFRRARGQSQLLNATKALESDIGDWLDNTDALTTAQAIAHIEHWGEQAKNEPIDFVAERITTKCSVPMGATNGHELDVHVALERLAEVAHQYERTLRAAVGANI